MTPANIEEEDTCEIPGLTEAQMEALQVQRERAAGEAQLGVAGGSESESYSEEEEEDRYEPPPTESEMCESPTTDQRALTMESGMVGARQTQPKEAGGARGSGRARHGERVSRLAQQGPRNTLRSTQRRRPPLRLRMTR